MGDGELVGEGIEAKLPMCPDSRATSITTLNSFPSYLPYPTLRQQSPLTFLLSLHTPAACSFPGENARSWEALGEARILSDPHVEKAE